MLAPYTLEENGKIERMWGATTPMVCCMIFDANLSKTYLSYALYMATKLKSLCGHSAKGKTPYESMCGEKHNLNFMKTLHVYVYFCETSKRGIFLGKFSKRGIFLGTSENLKKVSDNN